MPDAFAAPRRSALALLTLGLVGLLVISCGGGGGGGPSVTAPTVSSTLPPDGATNVAVDSAITITFSKAMNRSASEAAFSATPAIDCDFAWNAASTVLTCAPTADLATDTTYTVTVATSAVDAGGTPLAAPVSFAFSTGDEVTTDVPSVVATDPSDGASDVSIGTTINVTFSTQMDVATVQAAFSSQPPVACGFAWDASETTLTCTPNAELAPATAYTVTIAASASSALGTALDAAFTLEFTTGADVQAVCVFGTSTFGGCRFGP